MIFVMKSHDIGGQADTSLQYSIWGNQKGIKYSSFFKKRREKEGGL